MPCIIKKTKNRRAYYYAAESARTNGGPPRIIWQKYLGTLEDIMQRAQSSSEPHVKEVDIFEAGGVAVMLSIIKKIGIIEIIDQLIPKRNQGPSVGEYIALAMINRILAPCSKISIPNWYKNSVLSRLWKYDPEAFNSQRFWDHMDLFEEQHLEEIQKRVAKNIKELFSINPEVILYDTTNFYTYIASRNHRNTIAKRGKNKSKRNDLRQVGLALLVTKDFQIPLFHNVYQGNLPDRGIFLEISKQMRNQFEEVFGFKNTSTMVFDKGNVSEDTIESLFVSGQHFVCAVPKNTVNELFQKPMSEFKEVENLSGTKALTAEVEIWGMKLKSVVAYTDSYFSARMADLTESIFKCEQKLSDLNKDLSKHTKETFKKSRGSVSSVKNKVKDLLSGEYLKDIFEVKVLEGSEGIPHVSYSINHNELDYIMKHELGRTMLMTTRSEWDEKTIISAYRDQIHIENVMKKLKNRDYLRWQPEFHWTDQKIRVHGLYCVLALLVATLAHKMATENGMTISLVEMIEELSGIKEVALIYDEKKKQRGERNRLALSKMSGKQKKLAEMFNIASILKG